MKNFLLLFVVLTISLSTYAEKPKVPIDEVVDVGYADLTVKLVKTTQVANTDSIVINVPHTDVILRLDQPLLVLQITPSRENIVNLLEDFYQPKVGIGLISIRDRYKYLEVKDYLYVSTLNTYAYVIKPPQYKLSLYNNYYLNINSNYKNTYFISKYRNLPHKV